MPGCAISVAAAAAVLAVFVYLVASCATFGDTVNELDADGVHEVVRGWTGATLPEGLAVVSARKFSSRDPSMNAVFDAPSAGIEDFLTQLGERRLAFYAPDCADPSRPVRFDTAEPTRTVGAAPSSGSRIAGYSGGGGVAELVGAVESGELERCRSVVTVFANPSGAFVDAAVQAQADGVSRVILHVYYT
ncbi:hypothetical protein TPB0596_18970 [Tsukamurella pulmonis]|nr:hypothetical protein TPB0596_18970 [Tsukamurella pulmonis]